MKRDKLAELEFQVKHRLLEYLKADSFIWMSLFPKI